MQQFFIEAIASPQLSKEQLRQCKTVLRMKQNDTVHLVDRQGCGVLAKFSDETLENFEILEPLHFPKKKIKTKLIMSLIRAEALELTIQKAVELSVDEIIFYQAQHGVVRDYGKKTERKLARFKEIAKEAAEQSHAQYVPKIGPIITVNQLSSYDADIKLIADVNQDHFAHQRISDHDSALVVIGPEGGFSQEERDCFKELGYQSLSLSPFILRAETAALCALAHINLAKEMYDDQSE